MRYPTRTRGLLCAAALVSLMLAGAASAQTASVFREGDADMTCSQMADEAAGLSAGMGADSPGLFGVVKAVAETGASMLIPGAGLAMAGADALTRSGDERREAVAGAKRDRWNYLNGLYAGRGCNTAVAEAAVETQAGASAAPTPVQVDMAPTPVQPAPTSTPLPAPQITPTSLPH